MNKQLWKYVLIGVFILLLFLGGCLTGKHMYKCNVLPIDNSPYKDSLYLYKQKDDSTRIEMRHRSDSISALNEQLTSIKRNYSYYKNQFKSLQDEIHNTPDSAQYKLFERFSNTYRQLEP